MLLFNFGRTMDAEVNIGRRGQRLALRIPAEIVRRSGIEVSDPFDIAVDERSAVIRFSAGDTLIISYR